MFALTFYSQMPVASLGGNFYSVNTNEAYNTFDNYTASATYNGNTYETITLVDFPISEAAYYTYTIESIAIIDTPSSSVNFLGNIVDASGFFDNYTASATYNGNTNENITVSSTTYGYGWSRIANVQTYNTIGGLVFGGVSIASSPYSGYPRNSKLGPNWVNINNTQ